MVSKSTTVNKVNGSQHSQLGQHLAIFYCCLVLTGLTFVDLVDQLLEVLHVLRISSPLHLIAQSKPMDQAFTFKYSDNPLHFERGVGC